MTMPVSVQLSQRILMKAEEMRRLCEGIDEETAARAPADRWSPKQILSHLSGPEGGSFVASIQTILERDTPRIDIEAENPFFTEKRSRMTLAELLATFMNEYSQVAALVSKLSEAQLNRRAYVPLFKDLPMGEYPTLAELIGAIAEYHMDFHVNHMREVLQALAAA